jgi:DASS family divalent anion:Na+ symporter
MLLGPFIPSNTARGSVIMAIVASICKSIGSTTSNNPVTGGGQYLMLVGAHANLISASMYQTGMAANPIISVKAKEIFDVDWQFGQWLLGSWAPAITAFILLPISMKYLSRAVVDVSAVRTHVGQELQRLGPLKRKEKVLLFILLCCLALWVSSTFSGLDSTFIALLGVVSLLLTGTVDWDDMLKNSDAWDTVCKISC